MRPFDLTLEKAFYGERLEGNDVACLLATPPGKSLERLFSVARARRKRSFGDKIFLYGFVYFSTYCQNSCTFCLYRKPNEAAPRYRHRIKAVTDAVRALGDNGVHLIDLTMGEDPYYLQQDGKRLLELVVACREAVNLPVMLSPGVLGPGLFDDMASQGVDWYACYQETFNKTLFARLRQGQDFDRRLQAKVLARKAGMLIEEGLLIGTGENLSDTVLALREIEKIGASQVRAMTFRPQAGTPMANRKVPVPLDELRTIATFRLCFPDRLIPASLDVDGLEGLRDRLDAGANVVTSLIPPKHNLAGVSSALLGIEDGQRSVSAVVPLIEQMGLRIAPVSTYQRWLQKEKRRVGRQDHVDSKSM